MIEQLGFPGYFLLLHDIVEFCRRATSTARAGGAANNGVLRSGHLAGAVDLGLLFRRFLSQARRSPDIDLDIEHQRER